MLNTKEQVDAGNGATFTTESSWSPYNPIVPLTEDKDIVEIKVPSKEEFDDWMFNRIFGIGSSVTVDKYLNQDCELLKDRLNNALTNQDELKLLNWLYKILLGKGEAQKQLVCQMPEDTIRSFSLQEEYKKHREQGLYIIDSCIWISPIHENTDIDTEKDNRYTETPIYSLKLLSLWILSLLNRVKNDDYVADTLKISNNEVNYVYKKSHKYYWDMVGWCNRTLPLNWHDDWNISLHQGFLENANEYTLRVRTVRKDTFIRMLDSCFSTDWLFPEKFPEFLKRNGE